MSDTATHTSAEPQVFNSTTSVGEAFSLDGDAVEKLATLGARATGIDIVEVKDTAGDAGLPDSFPVAVIHGDNPKLASVKSFAEEWREYPEHRRGIAHVGDVESFIELTNRHKTDHSVVFAQSDWRKPSLTSVIDYHDIEPDARAGFGRHRVHYAFPFSDEWKTWLEHDGKPMDQREFAEFIEERAPDMTTLTGGEAAQHASEMQVSAIGTPAQIFELARGLEINVGGKVKQNVKLQSGEAKIAFEEEHTGKDGQPLTVPGAFALMIPLFYNEDPIVIPVRLRYRMVGGSIVWLYKLFRVDRLVAEAVRNAKNDVAAQTGLEVYEGAPEMSASGTPVGAAG
ncbi:DUF2303 family protein [Aureimonas mangrovi]|uniref:DUF2303 family protein n=1 Tax=Aureimonas mangrovi TaxID=2758041 RepID=UPI00163DE083|nr:DUF2303 family protein [Aureimonas mangrovi]